MADITDVDDIGSGRDLSEAEIKAIINRIQLTIRNIIDPSKKWAGVKYQEHGMEGHSKDPTVLLKELREQLAYWEEQLDSLPAYNKSQWDDPSL